MGGVMNTHVIINDSLTEEPGQGKGVVDDILGFPISWLMAQQ
jgi:hypothetical protein